MAYNKLNVFHWHITDSHSFPLELFKEPELAKKGAYSERHRYSHMDVKRVLEYATQHGVRIIPELDMPGKHELHTVTSFCSITSMYLVKEFDKTL
jgi:hexosaminidase